MPKFKVGDVIIEIDDRYNGIISRVHEDMFNLNNEFYCIIFPDGSDCNMRCKHVEENFELDIAKTLDSKYKLDLKVVLDET